jgi:very-short-patch-repair endonuclease
MSFAETYPELLWSWHPTKNGSLQPHELPRSSGKRIWWKCPKAEDHEWNVSINSRVNSSCPYCANKKPSVSNSLSALFPGLTQEWHVLNDKKPSEIVFGSHYKAKWKCVKAGHEWETEVVNRTKRNSGCPECGTRYKSDAFLDTTHPELAAEWDSQRNDHKMPSSTKPGTDYKAWWICSKGHSYQSKVSQRTRCASQCPICTGRKLHISNSIVYCFPDVAKEWHPTKNGTVKPEDIIAGSGKTVWWKCEKNHEWEAVVNNRTNKKHKCPACMGRVASFANNLLIAHPTIAAEWHPTKNGTKKPEEFTPSSHQKVWWQCPRNKKHEYQAKIGNRTLGNKTDCPSCNQSKMEGAVYEILKDKGIPFEGQKKFAELAFHDNKLSYDFFLPSWNAVIECDGRQHFEEALDYFHHQKSYAHQRLRDVVKNAFAAREGFALLRIAYTEIEFIPTLVETFLARLQRGECPYTFVGYPYRQLFKNLRTE